MTVDSKVDLQTMICEKCGSSMAYRKRKLATGEISNILQCVVCRHYEVLDIKQK